MADKNPTSFRLTEHALDLLAKIAEKQGVDKTAVLELLIRDRAQTLGIGIGIGSEEAQHDNSVQ